MLATGLVNAGRAFLGAIPGGGGTTQTAVNRLAGARTQLAEIVTSAMTLVTMLLLAPLIALMPQATLAAVVIVYSIGLIKPVEFREILNVHESLSTTMIYLHPETAQINVIDRRNQQKDLGFRTATRTATVVQRDGCDQP